MSRIIRLLIVLCGFLFSIQNASSKTLLVLGDSLSAGYNMPIEESWPSLLPDELEPLGQFVTVVNGAISGDTTGNGLERLPALLAKHKPNYVLIELGANDGLRGFQPQQITHNLEQIIHQIKTADAEPLLMQIEVPPNYGKRYSQAFRSLFPALSEKHEIPLLPFFLEQIITQPDMIMKDGLHPTPEAQLWIAEYMAEQLAPYL